MTTVNDDNTTLDQRRYRLILRFFAGLVLHLIWWDVLVGRLFKARVRASRPERFRLWARRFRGQAVELGGVMIKLGQFLSARVDVLPIEVTAELQGLQDEVPPVPAAAISAVLEQELGDPQRHFSGFDPHPIAAASLGQAHRAWLPGNLEPGDLRSGDPRANGATAVVVKVQRPNIAQVVRTDLAALRVVAGWAMRYAPIRRRANIPDLLEEFARTLWEELDYELEAANAEQFAAIFALSDGVRIPIVYSAHSTKRVLVLEDVSGIKIDDVAGLRAAGIDPKAVAERLLDVYFLQIFKEGFFHADPHPGNLFIRPLDFNGSGPADEETERPFELTFVDFGMVGRLKTAMNQNLRRVLTSVTQRDARELTLAYQEMGFFLPGSDLDRITEAQNTILNQIWGRNLLDLARPDPQEVQELGREFRDLLYEFPFQVPQDFIYLGRAMGMLSGLISLLDPEINPWYAIERYGREFSRGADFRDISRETVVELFRPFLSLPTQLYRLLALAEEGQLRVQYAPDRQTNRRLDRLEKRLGRLSWTILAAAGFLSGTLLYLDGAATPAAVAWGAALVITLWSLR